MVVLVIVKNELLSWYLNTCLLLSSRKRTQAKTLYYKSFAIILLCSGLPTEYMVYRKARHVRFCIVVYRRRGSRAEAGNNETLQARNIFLTSLNSE